MLLIFPFIAHRCSFSVAPGQCHKRTSKIHPAGAGNSKRPFARSQRRFRHHCEVGAPGLPLRIRVKSLPKPVRSGTPPLRTGFEAGTGRNQYPGPVVWVDPQRSRDLCRSPLPFRSIKPSGSKAFDRFHHRKLASRNVRLSLAPRRVFLSITLRINARNPFRFCLAIARFSAPEFACHCTC
jgi:hypothetical protein